ncbi:FUSC family protein|uniref:FUSC family protein n=1 Tax=Stenotrophomonas sp. SbOxS2 TaxID=2723885 RepID=UPI0015D3F8DF|nr:FUSC family protein [Stenotrophomonas sp. SbOxS2]NYT99370.1 FUSC family protein [Stenotrophomonas sp. SbOxS2]
MKPAASAVTVEAVVFSLKTFATAMLAYWLALRFGLKNPFWAVGTVYIIAHPLEGAITSKAVFRLTGTVLGAVATVALVPNLVSSPELLSLAVALWTGACLFVGVLDRTPRSYVFVLAGYTVVLTGLSVVNTPQTSFDTAVARVEEIGLGILCAALVSRAVLPQRAGKVMSVRVDAWLGNAAVLARDALSGAGTSTQALKARQALAADAVDLRSFTTHLGYETREDRQLVERMHALQARMVALLPLLSEIADMVASLDQSPHGRGEQGPWLERVSEWAAHYHSDQGVAETGSLLAQLQALAQNPRAADWRSLSAIRLAKRLRDLVEVWRDCHDLRVDLANGTKHPLSNVLGSGARTPVTLHTDYGMALLSAIAVVLAILISCALWIGTGWSYGLGAVQMASILCSVLATLDDAVPVIRKVLWMVLWATCAVFVYEFGILPALDGFLALVCALGLFLIPAGVLLAIPARWLLGFQLSVLLIYMLQLHDRPAQDFAAFANSSIATFVGIFIAIATIGTVRSVGAEASVRRLLHAGWNSIVTVATSRSSGVGEHMMHRMLDQVGLLVPRVAALPAGSDLHGNDLLRDLRVGLCVLKIQRNKAQLTVDQCAAAERLLEHVAGFYRSMQRRQPVSREALGEAIDAALPALLPTNGESHAPRRVRDALVGLRTAVLTMPPAAGGAGASASPAGAPA